MRNGRLYVPPTYVVQSLATKSGIQGFLVVKDTLEPLILSLVAKPGCLRQGPLAGLSERMRGVLHGAGAALASAGVADLGALVLQVADERRASGCAPG